MEMRFLFGRGIIRIGLSGVRHGGLATDRLRR